MKRGERQRTELDHISTHRDLLDTHVPCPRCGKRLRVTDFGSIREFNCSSKRGCGYSYDENVYNARGEQRGGR